MTEHAPQGPQQPLEGQLMTAPAREGIDFDQLEQLVSEKNPASYTVVPAIEAAPAHSVTITAPESTPVDVPVATGGHHRAPEGASDASVSVDGIISRLAAERQTNSPENQDRLLVRTFNRLANFASNRSEKWNSRRTTREFAGDQVERGRDVARQAGAAVVNSARATRETVSTRYQKGLEQQRKEWRAVREAAVNVGHAARDRKDQLVTSVKNRAGQVREVAGRGYEASKRYAKVGGNVLAAAGVVAVVAPVAVAVGAGYAVGKGAKYGAEKTAAGARVVGREVKRTANDVRENVADIRETYEAVREKNAAPRAARMENLAHDLMEARKNAAPRRMSAEEVAAARASALKK
jgi:hypothetical protein